MKPTVAIPDMNVYSEQSSSSGGFQPSAKDIYQQRKSYTKTIAAMGEVSEYKVEHLATFAMERKEAILTVDDGIRKLKLLDARNKIWTQEICLSVDSKSIKLIDLQEREELESIPLTALQYTQSVLNACAYDSICALVIKDIEQKTADIHLFQCSSVPADIICADISSAFQDIKQKGSKKNRPETLRKHRNMISSSAGSLSATPPVPVKERVAEWQYRAQSEPAVVARSPLVSQQEHSPEMVAFKIGRDVEMLNHALDDIEAFVSLLRKSAEATKELTVRQSKSKRSSKKKKMPGSGVLELRSRLPPQEQFVDVFKKFRFCFNLLSKLKSHIQDPNSAELVHFLFQPLRVIITTGSGPELARTVQSPLLNKDTVEFLHNCVTSEELDLWQDLGNYWTRSRSEFPRDMYFAPYVPKYFSGWEPPPILFMESEASGLAAAIQGQAVVVQRAEKEWREGGANIEDALKPLSPVQPTESTSPRTTMQLNGGNSAFAFKQHVQSHVARNQAAQGAMYTSPQEARKRKLCRAMYDFSARNEHEISVELDELLDVLDDSKSWWLVLNDRGETGYVPANLMLLISSASKPQAPSSSAFAFPTPEKAPSIPPPPPVSPTAVTAPSQASYKRQPIPLTDAGLRNVVLKKAPSMNKPRENGFTQDRLQQELQQRVSAQKKQRNFVIPKKNVSSGSMINDHSTANEVRSWLTSLGFSQMTVDSLGVLDGGQIFSLTKDELKQVCDDDGARVHSQLLVQKSLKNRFPSENSELANKLLRRRHEFS